MSSEFPHQSEHEKTIYEKTRCCVGMKNCVKAFPAIGRLYYLVIILSHTTALLFMCIGMFTDEMRESELFNPFAIVAIVMMALNSLLLVFQKFKFFTFLNSKVRNGPFNTEDCWGIAFFSFNCGFMFISSIINIAFTDMTSTYSQTVIDGSLLAFLVYACANIPLIVVFFLFPIYRVKTNATHGNENITSTTSCASTSRTSTSRTSTTSPDSTPSSECTAPSFLQDKFDFNDRYETYQLYLATILLVGLAYNIFIDILYTRGAYNNYILYVVTLSILGFVSLICYVFPLIFACLAFKYQNISFTKSIINHTSGALFFLWFCLYLYIGGICKSVIFFIFRSSYNRTIWYENIQYIYNMIGTVSMLCSIAGLIVFIVIYASVTCYKKNKGCCKRSKEDLKQMMEDVKEKMDEVKQETENEMSGYQKNDPKKSVV